MATASITYTFSDGSTVEASEHNKNFQDVVDFLNNSTVHTDASKAFTGVPSGPSTDPTSDDQFTRKKYVDDLADGKAAASHAHAAGDVTSGTFADARIPSLAASKVTSGTFDAARIPDLDPDKINAGTFESGTYTFPTRVGVGGTDATRAFYVESADPTELYRETTTAGDGILVLASNIGGTGDPKHIFYADGTATFDGALTAPSDLRLKDNIQYLDSEASIERLMSWDFVTYELISDGSPGRGVIAQQIEPLTPDLVRGASSDMDYMSVNYIGMIPDIARTLQAVVDKLDM